MGHGHTVWVMPRLQVLKRIDNVELPFIHLSRAAFVQAHPKVIANERFGLNFPTGAHFEHDH